MFPEGNAGPINADLTIGVDVTRANALRANEGLCSPGVKLHGAGFIVTPAQAAQLGLGRRPGLENHIRPYFYCVTNCDGCSGDVRWFDSMGSETASWRERRTTAFAALRWNSPRAVPGGAAGREDRA